MKKTLIVGHSFIGKHLFHSMKNVDIIHSRDLVYADFGRYDTEIGRAHV